MPTEDAYSSGHLVLSRLGFAKWFFVETTHTQSYITPVYDTLPWLDFLPNLTLLLNKGFHRASATGVACRQGTLTPPDSWSCPTLGLACVLMSRPISPELVLSPYFWISNIPRYFSFAFSRDCRGYLCRQYKVKQTYVSTLMTFCIVALYSGKMCNNFQKFQFSKMLIFSLKYTESYFIENYYHIPKPGPPLRVIQTFPFWKYDIDICMSYKHFRFVNMTLISACHTNISVL